MSLSIERRPEGPSLIVKETFPMYHEEISKSVNAYLSKLISHT